MMLNKIVNVYFSAEANQLAQCLRSFDLVQLRVKKLSEVVEQQESLPYKQLAEQEQTLAKKVRSKAVSCQSQLTHLCRVKESKSSPMLTSLSFRCTSTVSKPK